MESEHHTKAPMPTMQSAQHGTCLLTTDKERRSASVVVDSYVSEHKSEFRQGALYLNMAMSIYRHGVYERKNFGIGPKGFRLIDITIEKAANKKISKIVGIIEESLPDDIPDVPEEMLETLLPHKREAISYCLDCHQHDLLVVGWQYKNPAQLSKLCVALADIKSDDTVYLPFSGLAEDAVIIHQALESDKSQLHGVEITGEEYDPLIWAIGQIYLWANDIPGYTISCGDSFERMKDQSEKYNRIIMSPPYNTGDKADRFHNELGKALRMAVEKLDDFGICVAVVPAWLSSGSGPQHIRGGLLGRLSMVIYLPEIMGRFTTTAYEIWVLDRHCPESVLLVNGAPFVHRVSSPDAFSNDTCLDYERLISCIRSVDSRYCIVKDKRNLDLGLNISPRFYFGKNSLPSFPMTALWKLTDEIEVKDGKTPAPVISVTDLTDDYLDADISPRVDLNQRQTSCERILCEDAILISPLTTMVVGKFFPTKDIPAVSIPKDIAAIRIDPGKVSQVDEYYLMKFLTSDFVASTLGSPFDENTFSYVFFSRIEMPLPDMEVQQREVNRDLKQRLTDVRVQHERETADFSRIMHMRRHTLASVAGSIHSAYRSVLKLINNTKEGEALCESQLSAHSTKTFGDVINQLTSKLNKMSEIVDHLIDPDVSTSDIVPSKIDVNKYLRQLADDNVTYPINVIENYEDTGACILIARESLDEIFRNIISNAVQHGFAGNPNPSRDEIRITWKLEDNRLVVNVANNGKPLAVAPEKVLIEGVSTAEGKGSHEGLGGAIIRAKMKEQGNGSVEVISTPDSEFTVCYRLMFNRITLG